MRATSSGFCETPRYVGSRGAPPTIADDLRERIRVQEGRRSPEGDELWLNWTLRLRSSGQAIGYVQAGVRVLGRDAPIWPGWSGSRFRIVDTRPRPVDTRRRGYASTAGSQSFGPPYIRIMPRPVASRRTSGCGPAASSPTKASNSGRRVRNSRHPHPSPLPSRERGLPNPPPPSFPRTRESIPNKVRRHDAGSSPSRRPAQSGGESRDSEQATSRTLSWLSETARGWGVQARDSARSFCSWVWSTMRWRRWRGTSS